MRSGDTPLAALFTACMVLKLVLVVLEETPKEPLLPTDEKAAILEERVGIINRSLFFWLNPFLKLGSNKKLTIEDIGPIHHKMGSGILLSQLDAAWSADGKYNLLATTFWTFRWQFFSGIVPRLLSSAFSLSQPFIINTIISHIAKPVSLRDSNVENALIGATLLIYVGMAITSAWYQHTVYQLMTMYRGAIIGLIYKKTLDLAPSTIKDAAPTTLMSTDVEGIAMGIAQIHDVWASFIELPVALYLLYRQVGIPSLFIIIPSMSKWKILVQQRGSLIFAVTTMITAWLTPKIAPARVKWNEAIQKRIGDISDMLSQIKAIKMMGLAELFQDRAIGMRCHELKLSVHYRLIVILVQSLAILSEDITPIIVILGAIYWTTADQGLTVAQAFTSLSIIAIATTPIYNIISSVTQLFSVVGCFSRIQVFLTLPSHKDLRTLTPENDSTNRDGDSELAVEFRDASFAMANVGEILRNINLRIPTGTLSIVVGPIGSGKSSLLKAIVGELQLNSGTITTSCLDAAYCDQTPWIINASIKNNVIGQSALDPVWLQTVLHACSLDEDISTFPSGVDTVVGTAGISLSGGQKQRLAVARAIYSHKTLLVLDDVFSGLDNKTAQKLFQRVFSKQGLLHKDRRTVVLVINKSNLLPAADYITMLEKGTITHNQVSYTSIDPLEWGLSDDDSSGSDFENNNHDENVNNKTQPKKNKVTDRARDVEVELERQTSDWECYKIYFKAIGWDITLVLIPLLIAGVVLEKMPQFFLREWTQAGTKGAGYGYMSGYIASAILGAVFISLSIAVLYFTGIPRSANRLHTMLTVSVVCAPLRFFTTTDSGVTLNRFSQDMSLIDQALPAALFGTMVVASIGLVEAAFILSGSSYMVAILPFGLVGLYFIQRFYLRTSRQMRLLDLEMKSPLYTQFSETLAGLSTIRAFCWTEASRLENSKRINTSQRPYYMLFCIQRWLQVVLDLFAAAMALVLVSLALKIPWATSDGAFGLAMINMVSFNLSLTRIITSWTQLEMSLGAIARLKWFIKSTRNENKPDESYEPPSDWPSRGSLEFKNVSASYSDDGVNVIKDVSFSIKTGQKVGICGRSGSGKSSLLAVLSRLGEVSDESHISIDGIDLKTIPRQTIRSRIAGVPQDSLRLNDTVRVNLDPTGTAQADQPLIDALVKTEIWPLIESRGGLDAMLDDIGLSAGQMQLFNLARVVMRPAENRRLVLLDEATSSVDRLTDSKVRAAISKDLEASTVMEVAHHLEIVRNYDVILVLVNGRLVEVGSPESLLARPDSELQSLWANRGF